MKSDETTEKTKRVHWMHTAAGRRRWAQIKRERRAAAAVAKTEKPKSKADRLIKKTVGKKVGPNRDVIYMRAIDTAMASGEIEKLIGLIGGAMMLSMFGRR